MQFSGINVIYVMLPDAPSRYQMLGLATYYQLVFIFHGDMLGKKS